MGYEENNIVMSRTEIPANELRTLRVQLLAGGICEALLKILSLRAQKTLFEDSNESEGVILLLQCLQGLLDNHYESDYEPLLQFTGESPGGTADTLYMETRDRMVQCGLFPIISSTLDLHLDDVDIMISWCDFVCRFIKGNESFSQKFMMDSKLSVSMTLFLTTHGSNTNAVEAACRVVNALSLVRESRVRLGQDGILCLLVYIFAAILIFNNRCV